MLFYAQGPAPPLPVAAGDSDLELSDEDVAFVAQHSSRLAFLSQLSDKALHGCGPGKAAQ